MTGAEAWFGRLGERAAMADSSIVIADLQGKLRPTVPEQVPAVRWRFCVLTDPPKAARFRAGEMSEWSKVPDSKSGVGQPTKGSNPLLSANEAADASH